jgi:hypothetical protein
MSNQLPANLEQEQQEKNDAVAAYMTGKEGLEIFCAELREKGVELPARNIWKYAERKHIESAVHATFSMLGGVPGMALWASKNPSLFYPAFIKLAPTESNITGASGNIFINTAVPESPLDAVEIDKFGRIKE